MPIYEYKCNECSHIFEIMKSSKDEKEAKLVCPRCGAKESVRVISSFSSLGGSYCEPSRFS
ncbi:MAG: zinc ribbon domain-containing protein [Nitrospirae bacterium]|nr:zinc ribbon domain-containing protein [Nitrospirota bacterium]